MTSGGVVIIVNCDNLLMITVTFDQLLVFIVVIGGCAHSCYY